MTGDKAVICESYRSNSFRHLLLLIGNLVFVVAAVFVARRGGAGAIFGAVAGAGFFGLNALVFGMLILRAHTLVLDREGFALTGGLMREPHRTSWRDVRGFRIWRSGRWFGPKLVAFDYAPSWEPPAEPPRVAKLLAFHRRKDWPDAALPAAWSISAIALCEKLNDYKARSMTAEVEGDT